VLLFAVLLVNVLELALVKRRKPVSLFLFAVLEVNVLKKVLIVR